MEVKTLRLKKRKSPVKEPHGAGILAGGRPYHWLNNSMSYLRRCFFTHNKAHCKYFRTSCAHHLSPDILIALIPKPNRTELYENK